MAPRKPSATEPRIVDLPPRRMAVVRARGSPDEVFPKAMPALYGSVYTLKFDLKKRGLPSFSVGPPRARYPDALNADKNAWTIVMGIPVPDDTAVLTQKVPGVEVKLETWDYGPAAEVLHLGPYDEVAPAIEKLHQFVRAAGYEIAGYHEEEYLSRPDARAPKTMIRYQVKKV